LKQLQNITFHHRTNDITSGVLHLIGALFAVAALAVLIVLGASRGGTWHVVSYSLYGSGLIILYAASSAYHLIPHKFTKTKLLFQHLDHAAIYILIAATYTPITFIALAGGWRWSIFGVIWGLAILGAALKISRLQMLPWLSAVLYLVMGWLITVAFVPLIQSMTAATLWLLVAGGLSYTVGLAFFALDRVLPHKKYFWMHEIFHVFVLGGSTLHTIVMFLIL